MSSIVKNKALRTMKVFLTLFFAVLMIMPVFSPVSKVEASIESDLANKRNELKKLEGLLADAREEKSKILESLRETEGKLNSYLVEKSRLETSIGYSEKEIELINSLVEGYSQQIEELDENLKKVEKLKNEKISQLCLVLKYIYENKDVSSMELFFSSENFSQYVSKKEYAKSVLYYQETIISEIEKTESESEQMRKDYEIANASLVGYKKTLEEKKVSVDAEYKELEKVIYDLENTLELKEEDYNAINDIEKDYASEIGKVKVDIAELTEYLSTQFRWPFSQNQKYYISSYFGYRNGPYQYEHHNGVDIVVPKGTSILASAGGVVTRSEYAPVFGNVVVISHGNGLQTLYCHCSSRLVSVGDKVKQGEVIAKVGSTGQSTGPHLHFAFILNGSYVNPQKYVSKEYF